MASLVVGLITAIIFLAISVHTLLDVLRENSGRLRVALAGGGIITFLILSVAASWYLYKAIFYQIGQ